MLWTRLAVILRSQVEYNFGCGVRAFFKFLSWPIEDLDTVLIKTTDVPKLLKEASTEAPESPSSPTPVQSRVVRTKR
jgi:hypothetical protein